MGVGTGAGTFLSPKTRFGDTPNCKREAALKRTYCPCASGSFFEFGERKSALDKTIFPDPLDPGGKGLLILRQFIVASVSIVTDYTQERKI